MNIISCRVIEISDESSSSSNDFELKFTDSESEIDNKLGSQSLQLVDVVSDKECDINSNKTVEKSPSSESSNNCFKRGISSSTGDRSEYVLFEAEDEEENSLSQSSDRIRIYEVKEVPCEPLSINNNNIEVKTSISNNFDNENKEYCSSEDSELELKSFKKIRKTHVRLFSSDDSSSDRESFADLPHKKVKRPKRRCTTRNQLLNQKKVMQKQILETFRQKRSRATRSLIPFVDRPCTTPKSSKSAKQKLLREMVMFRVNLIPGWK